MKNSDRRNRFNQPFNPDSQNVITLPLGGKILSGKLILTGTVTLATTNPGTVIGVGGPARLFKRIQIAANPASGPNGPRYPGGNIVDVAPGSLIQMARKFRFGQYLADQTGETLGGGASGTYPVYCSIPIYWKNPRLKKGIQTALNTDGYQTIQVIAQTADITNCFTGWTGAATYNLSVQWVDDRENFSGDTYVVFMEDHDFLIPATAQRAMDLAMPQDGAYESWLIAALQSAQETPSDGLLNRLRISGDAIEYDKYAQDIRQQMFDDALAQYGSTVAPTGLYDIDFTDGLIGGTIGAAGLNWNFDVTNISGANLDKLRFITRRLFQPIGFTPVGGKAAAQNQ